MSKVRFNGDGKEFFGIWIFNTLLSIVTLGIYSPWAKVQNTKYLYNNLSICLLYTSPSPRDQRGSRMPSSA